MKKKISFFLVFAFLLCGCTGYERDTSPGETIEISLKQMGEMMDNKQEFVVVLTQAMCGYCAEFHEIFNEYKNDHHVVIYEVPLEKETASVNDNRQFINKYFPSFSDTPGIFYAKDGKVVNQISNSHKLTEELFDNWVQKYQLDEKKD